MADTSGLAGWRRFSFQSYDSLAGIDYERTLTRGESSENTRTGDNSREESALRQHPWTGESAGSSSTRVTETYELQQRPSSCQHPQVPHRCSMLCNADHNVEHLDQGDVEDRPSRPMPTSPRQSQILAGRPCYRRKGLRLIWWPLLLTSLPMIIIPALLVTLVIKYRIVSEHSLFSEALGATHLRQRQFILLSVPATWIVFVASRASQVASLLAGPIMTLWTWKATQSMLSLSVEERRPTLPTPKQLALLLGVLMASLNTLWDYIVYRHRRRSRNLPRAPISPVVKRAALMLYLTLFLSGAVFVADTVLHYTTSTIDLDDISISTQLGSAGRGLSATCLDFDRGVNSGFSCARNVALSVSDFDAYLEQQNEMFYLQHNTSRISEIRLAPAQKDSEEGDTAILLTKSDTLSPFVDFRAPTIGISTVCEPITDKCMFGVWGPDNSYSGFYCSPYFYGALGKPVVMANDTSTTDDRDIPPLASKLSPALQISFFKDENLEILYNTRSYNLTTGYPDPSVPFLQDDQLVNKVYVAVAGRISMSNMRADNKLTGDPGFFKGPGLVLDIVMRCHYQAYNVAYTWFNSTLQDVHLEACDNGTISEIYHGSSVPTSVSGTNPAYVDMLLQAGMQATVADFCGTWANLFSVRVMTIIGGVTAPRLNMIEQDRVPRLAVKIWIPSLVWLVLCCLMYPVAGVVLAILAVETSRKRCIHRAVESVSIFGLAEHAFRNEQGEDEVASGGRRGSQAEDDPTTGGYDDSIRIGFDERLAFKKWTVDAARRFPDHGVGDIVEV